MNTIKLEKEVWSFEKAEAMEKPWEHWDNGYTRFRRLQWESQQKTES